MGGGARGRLRATAAAACCALALAGAGAGAAERGRWSVEATPNPPGPLDSELFGVSCPSASACLAVGYATGGAAEALLAERFDGVRWRLAQPAVPAGAVTAAFVGVSCASTAACTAVGNYRDRTGLTLTLAERWDGSAWAIEPTPDPGRRYPHPTLDSGTEFSGVSCASASACVAVGDYLDRRHRSVALVERWDGSRWSLERTPDAVGRQLGGAFCPAASACVAVGERHRGFGVLAPVAERSTGPRWMLVAAPAANVPGSMTSILVSVSCSSARSCAAVGDRSTAAGAHAPFVERLSGSAWSIEATPPRADAALGGVSCGSAGDCTAVGLDAGSNRGRTLPLVERWNGRSWSLEAGAALGRDRTAGALAAVSCPSPTVCVAVGFATYDAGGVVRTLTLAERRGG
ncbi:MAG TPA: hypothetical protein VN740_02030 [Solirubrobacteraceae bacterium]|nr:hypothetical protein [Solirubrobacteraceae bacterium]